MNHVNSRLQSGGAGATIDIAPLSSRPNLAPQLRDALSRGDDRVLEALLLVRPVDRRDAALTLATIYELDFAPIETVGSALTFQGHPVVATMKWQLQNTYLQQLIERDDAEDWELPVDPVAALRIIAKRDQLPPVYTWVAESATLEELKTFIALEGGPDGGFDDLVALCQIGLSDEPKLELAQNYWDEMGRGSLPDVHTELHRKLSRTLDLKLPDATELPVEALERSILGSFLAANRKLQPEMIGALGMIELQAGPRCRKVVQGMNRLGLGPDALHFYEEHAVADPRHGKDWLDKVVFYLGQDDAWARGIVRGARWRSLINGAFLQRLGQTLGQV